MRFDGEKLKALRSSRRWDQHRAAEECRRHGVGITQSQISRYENGQEPSGRNTLALAAAFGVEPRDLYSADAEEEEPVMATLPHRDMLEALHSALTIALGKSKALA